MRFARFSILTVFAALAISACSSPTANDDPDCDVTPELCDTGGHPTTGN